MIKPEAADDFEDAFTPEEAAFWLGIDLAEFLTVWLRGYKKYLSPQATRKTDPRLNSNDLAFFEQAVELHAGGLVPHKTLKRYLTQLYDPQIQARAQALLQEYQAMNGSGDHADVTGAMAVALG